MKKIYTILAIFGSLQAFALSPVSKTSIYAHMLEVNKEWKTQDKSLYQSKISFTNDQERIRMHLLLLIEDLKNKKTSFTKDQLTRRMTLLHELQIYAETKVFPLNLNHRERTPFFIDHLGTYCAVGYLMKQSGYQELALTIKQHENNAYLRDIKTPGVGRWAEQHGFTLDELAWIQPGYEYNATYETPNGTVNGKVTEMEQSIAVGTNALVFAGEFTEINSLPCLSVGYYANNQLSCLGGGVDGVVNDLKSTMNGLYVGGKFLHQGQNYPLASYVNGQWEFIALPQRPDCEIQAIYLNQDIMAFNKLEIVTKSAGQDYSEVWSFDESQSAWIKRAEINGRVYDISSDGDVFVGAFDSVSVFTNEQFSHGLSCKNIISQNSLFEFDNSIQGNVSDTIYSVLKYAGILYFGGTFSGYTPYSIAITKYENQEMDTLVGSQFLQSNSQYDYISDMEFDNVNNRLLFSGKFTAGMMYYGEGFAYYDFAYSFANVSAFGNLHGGETHTFANYQGNYYFGGAFQNYLLRGTSMGLVEPEKEKLSIFPNPASDKLEIKPNQAETYNLNIFEPSGKLIGKQRISESTIIDLENYESGIYFFEFESENGNKLMRKVVVN